MYPKGRIAPVRYLRSSPLGCSVNNVRGRSYGAGVAPHDPGSIGPGLCGFPRTLLLGFSVNRDNPSL